MAKIKVKRVLANITIGQNMEPHWIADVDYGAFEVQIPLPARCLLDDDFETQTREYVEAMESLAAALLRFAEQTRKQCRPDRD
jgi:hypothetical protein